MEKTKAAIAPFEVPKAVPGTTKLDQLKSAVTTSISEMQLTLRGIQRVLEAADASGPVVAMVQHIKTFKSVLDSTP